MKMRLDDILGIELAEALGDDGEEGHGCAKELRFDCENAGFNDVNGNDGENDIYVYEEETGIGEDVNGNVEGEEEEGSEEEGQKAMQKNTD
ncbi:uncharacterized protein LOC110697887 isoform X2 [Chenopodium quinoa]|uniref:uncharacterized protein LOC110697887 isoform X2 n=1 Tax=Chenopodium quinoa TaxID=63459 RepID=UPI000B7980F8|nr:uncharacterized protein LOC110697887 isoform X2 [Chenopodium quinoa]